MRVGVLARIDTGGPELVVGRVVDLAPGGIRIAVPPPTAPHVLVGLDVVRRYSVGEGHDRARGARRGAFGGLAAGVVLVGAASIVDARHRGEAPTVPVRAFAGGAALALTAGGALVGALVAPVRWSRWRIPHGTWPSREPGR